MMRFEYVSIFAALVLTVGAHAAPVVVDRECPGAAKMKASLGATMGIYEKTTAPFVDCDTNNISYRVRKAIFQLQNPGAILFASNRFHYEQVGFDAFKYVNDVIKHIFLDVDAPDRPEYLLPGVASKTRIGGEVTKVLSIAPNAVQLSELEMRAMIVHLSAHHHDGIEDHTYCRRGPFATVPRKACDAAWYQGAFSAEAEYLIGQAGAPTVPAAVRAEARALALERILYHTNDMPKWLKQGVYVYPREGGVSFFDGQDVIPLLKALPAGAEIASNPERVTVADRSKGLVMDYDYRQSFVPRPDKFAIKESFLRSDYRDVVEIGDMICALYDVKVTCQSKLLGFETVTQELGSGFRRFQWVRAKASFVREGDSFAIALQIIKDDGSALVMPKTFAAFKESPKLDAAVALPATIPNEVDRIFFPKWNSINFKYDVLAIDRNGTAYSSEIGDGDEAYRNGEGKMIETPELKGLKFRRIVGPAYWGKALGKI